MTVNATTTKTVPRRAMLFAAEFAPTDETAPQRDANGQLAIPFTMTARTGGVAQHPWWGNCIHDFEGMIPAKAIVSVDYCHNPEDVVGFSDKLELTNNTLMMSGQLISLESMDRAEEIFRKRKAGVPYEASILTNWDGLIVEHLCEGMATTVNGQQVEGPMTIFRKWQVWGVAVTPYGSDANTGIQFAAGVPGEVSVSVIEREIVSNTPAPAAKTGKDFMAKFGAQKGALWFAEGKSWEESLAQFEADTATEAEAKDKELTDTKAAMAALQAKYDALVAENEKVKGENAGLKRGTFPIPTEPPSDRKPTNSQFAHLSPGVGAFASTIKLPQASKN